MGCAIVEFVKSVGVINLYANNVNSRHVVLCQLRVSLRKGKITL